MRKSICFAAIFAAASCGPIPVANEEPNDSERSKGREEEAEENSVTARKSENSLEQTIFEAFPEDGSEGSASSKRDIATALNMQGFPCAEPYEMQEVADGQYAIGCIRSRNGNGAAIYLVHPASNNITKL